MGRGYYSRSDVNIYKDWYNGSTLMGDSLMDYYLIQNKNETVADYDYFTVKEVTTKRSGYEVHGNDFRIDYWKDTFDLTFSADNLVEAGPESSSSTSSWSVSLSWPTGASLGWSWSSGESFKHTLDFDQYNDKATYTQQSYSSYLDNYLFYPGATWSSYGTNAYAQLYFKPTFVYVYTSGETQTYYGTEKSYTLSYDYQ